MTFTPQPLVLLVRAPGTNCDLETQHAFELAGARVQSIHIRQLLEEPQRLESSQILCIPGGFSYGDDIAAGRIFAQELRGPLGAALEQFRAQEKLILGICNGFQVLLQTDLLLNDNFGSSAQATLTLNASGKFEDRWIHLQVADSRSIFLRGITHLYLPIAHAEGRFATTNSASLDRLRHNGQVALTYAAPPRASDFDNTMSSLAYPWNPNGSVANIAGLSDSTGRVLGLMPHPERYVDRIQHPRWTREDLPEEGAGLAIFRNAVRYFTDGGAV